METAPMLAPWDDLAPVVLALMQADRSLYQRLVCAPPRAFHCYAIFLRLSEDAQKKSDGALAEQMYSENPLDLVREVFPMIGADLLRVLARLGPRVWTADQYRELDQALRSAARDALMAENRLTPEMVAKARQLKDLPLLVATITPKLGYNIKTARQFGIIFDILRQYGVLETEAEAAAILRKVRPDRLGRFVGRRLSRIKPPPLPLALPPQLRLMETLADVSKAGHRYANCLADYQGIWRAFIMGELRFLEWCGEESGMISIRTYLGNLWVVEEIKGPQNKNLSLRSVEAIFDTLRNAGLNCIDNRTGSRLDWLTDSTADVGQPLEEDEEAFLDALAEI